MICCGIPKYPWRRWRRQAYFSEKSKFQLQVSDHRDGFLLKSPCSVDLFQPPGEHPHQSIYATAQIVTSVEQALASGGCEPGRNHLRNPWKSLVDLIPNFTFPLYNACTWLLIEMCFLIWTCLVSNCPKQVFLMEL